MYIYDNLHSECLGYIIYAQNMLFYHAHDIYLSVTHYVCKRCSLSLVPKAISSSNGRLKGNFMSTPKELRSQAPSVPKTCTSMAWRWKTTSTRWSNKKWTKSCASLAYWNDQLGFKWSSTSDITIVLVVSSFFLRTIYCHVVSHYFGL